MKLWYLNSVFLNELSFAFGFHFYKPKLNGLWLSAFDFSWWFFSFFFSDSNFDLVKLLLILKFHLFIWNFDFFFLFYTQMLQKMIKSQIKGEKWDICSQLSAVSTHKASSFQLSHYSFKIVAFWFPTFFRLALQLRFSVIN